MPRGKVLNDDEKQGQFLRAGEATRTSLLGLEEAHHRFLRLYPQRHDYLDRIYRLHEEVMELYQELDKEYARLFLVPEGEFGKVLRRTSDWPIPWEAGKEVPV